MTRDNTEADGLEHRLQGTPIGGPDGFVCCDSCNKSLADVCPSDGPTVYADTIHIYVTTSPGADEWRLRWASCEDCGPVGEGVADEPGEVHAIASLAYNTRRAYFALADVTMTAVERAASEEVA